MRTRTALTAALVVAAISVAAPIAANASSDLKVHAKLSAGAVIPGPGDEGASGKFKAKIKGDTLCYKLKAENVDGGATSAHIHAGDSASTGGIVVTLETPGDDAVKGCFTAVADEEDTEATLSVSELAAIVADPSQFYVDVHSDLFPDGAIRGQLK